MFKGFLSGLFWGGMVGALVLAVLSLYAPLPTSQADAEVGAIAPAAAANPNAPEENPVTAIAEHAASDAADENTEVAQSPSADELKATAEPDLKVAAHAVESDTETVVAAAETAVEGGLSPSADLADGITATSEEPVVAQVEETLDIDLESVLATADTTAAQPEALLDETTPSVASSVQVPSFNDSSDVSAVTLPQGNDEAVSTPEAPNSISIVGAEPLDQPLVVSDKPMDALPVAVLKTSPGRLGFADGVAVQSAPDLKVQSDEVPQTMTTALVAPVIGELTPQPVENPDLVRVADTRAQSTGRLPQIGVDRTDVSADTPIGVQVAPITSPLSSRSEQVVTGRLPTIGGSNSSSTQAVEPAVETPSQGALLDHAAQFQTNAQSLFSIVIIDVGDEGVAREQLLNSSYPISVAIDPASPNAASLMAQYRAAGIEVMALLDDLPRSAAPGDVAVALSSYLGVLDEAIAIMEPLDKRLQRDRNLLQPVLGAIAETGHGFVTHAQGLNSALQSAKRSGVPAAGIFRILDAEGENPSKIKRYLKRAAFNAGKDGSVVVVGRSYSGTMSAILEWALENNDASISLAPVSAVLKADLPQERS